MLNYRTLGKLISKAGLWDKPLSQFSEEEILKLLSAFAVAQVDHKTCGWCWYFGWVKLQPYCLHSDHPAPVYPFMWGNCCPDFSADDAKEFQHRPLNRKPKWKESESPKSSP